MVLEQLRVLSRKQRLYHGWSWKMPRSTTQEKQTFRTQKVKKCLAESRHSDLVIEWLVMEKLCKLWLQGEITLLKGIVKPACTNIGSTVV